MFHPTRLTPYLELLEEFIADRLPADVFQAHLRTLWASDTTRYPLEVRRRLEHLVAYPDPAEGSSAVELKLEADRVRLELQDLFPG
ncbi:MULTISPECIES: hypothetical protein [unclassified Meiothermus]|uniref:hypothetical protein n=1 Tax=unclassified Meiothermus TaxID=370471 RepID=UPI000D7C8978|nr:MULTISPECIES: hypothetical protein [unclassified Meiothermus]PZA08802.1 hypothetical protein DNA98_01820 [Meiothermus sp. Pnk-1]RYM40575.1 hypothetical protein EWH23_00120 [Meiothermus sp. PNK-Is4]